MHDADCCAHAFKKSCVEREGCAAEGTPAGLGSGSRIILSPSASSARPSPCVCGVDAYEQTHVHDVYRAIAGHFSSTRYKGWPQVKSFLERLPPYSWIADVGCGNGKYFAACQQHCVDATEANTSTCAPCSAGAMTSPLTPTTPLAARDTSNKVKHQNNIVNSCNTNRDSTSYDKDRIGDDVDTNDNDKACSLSSKDDHEDARCVATVRTHRFALGMDYSDELLRLTQRVMADPNMTALPLTRSAHSSPSQGGRPVLSSNVKCNMDNWVHERLPTTDVLRCDSRACPLRPGLFDAAISIAVIHHYASHARRVESVRELLRLVRPNGGLVLIYVWALEQSNRPKRVVVDESTGDAMVRWEMHGSFSPAVQTFQRYYHLFRRDELEEVCREAAQSAGVVCSTRRSYFDKENWCVVLERQ